MESGDVGKSFEDIIRSSWGEETGRFEDSSGEPRRGALQLSDGRWCERRPDGTWRESETGSPLPSAVSNRLEELWQEWAPRLPDEVYGQSRNRTAAKPVSGNHEGRVPNPRRQQQRAQRTRTSDRTYRAILAARLIEPHLSAWVYAAAGNSVCVAPRC